MVQQISFLCILCLLFSCKPYQDSDPFTDPRLVNKYCNIPSAINYNWNFPGVEDNSTCIFPAQLFSGNYFYRDSIYNSTGLPIGYDSFPLVFTAIDTTRLRIDGFCTGPAITAKANRYYKLVLDSVIKNGQVLCGMPDTISGRGSKTDIYDTTSIKLIYETSNDSTIHFHVGTATKQ